jgi:hypothetical protein
MDRTACQTPPEHCSGGLVPVNAMLNRDKARKLHVSPQDAFACYSHYLTGVAGYERVGSKEFRPPGGGPILVLTRPGRYGGAMRKGKPGTGTSATRYMPRSGRKHCRSGVFVG